MTMNFFYYSIQTKVLRNENNLIESFKLHRIQKKIKFPNYLVQTQSKEIWSWFWNGWIGGEILAR